MRPPVAPPLSAIVPCYNSAATLAACIDALRQGSYAPGQILVVDDASDDDSAAVAATHGATVLQQVRRRGPAAARNRGLAAAAHDWVLLCDADVVVAADAVAQAVAALAEWPAPGGIQGVYARRFGGRSTAGAYKHAQQCANIAALTAGPLPVLGSSLALVDRRFVLAVGGFDETLSRASIEDRLLGTRMATAGRPMVLVPAVEGSHRHEYDWRGLCRTDFRRARDEVVHGAALGPAQGYVSGSTRLRYALWLAALLLFPTSPWWQPASVVAVAALATALALDAVTVLRTTGMCRLSWLVLAIADHCAVVAGAVTGLWQRGYGLAAARLTAAGGDS